MVARSKGLVCGLSLKGTKGSKLVNGIVGVVISEVEASTTVLSPVHRRPT